MFRNNPTPKKLVFLPWYKCRLGAGSPKAFYPLLAPSFFWGKSMVGNAGFDLEQALVEAITT